MQATFGVDELQRLDEACGDLDRSRGKDAAAYLVNVFAEGCNRSEVGNGVGRTVFLERATHSQQRRVRDVGKQFSFAEEALRGAGELLIVRRRVCANGSTGARHQAARE